MKHSQKFNAVARLLEIARPRPDLLAELSKILKLPITPSRGALHGLVISVPINNLSSALDILEDAGWHRATPEELAERGWSQVGNSIYITDGESTTALDVDVRGLTGPAGTRFIIRTPIHRSQF